MKARTLAAALTVVAIAGCSSAKPQRTVIGVRKVALAMAFSDQALKTVVPPRIVVEIIPAPPEAIVAALPEAAPYIAPRPPAAVTPPAPPPPAACPTAPKGGPLPDPAPVAISKPPVAGTYVQRNKGTIKINGAIPLTFPYPAISLVVVRDVKVEDVPDPLYGTVRTTSFTLQDQVTPTIKTVSRYEFNATQMNLVQRDVVNGQQVTSLKPTPGVEVLGFGGPGSSWTSAGIDPATANALAVQGTIPTNEAVDLCGKLVDTLKVSTDEHQVNATTGDQSGTRAGTPTVTSYATQLGGLPVRREQHVNQVASTDAGPVSFDTDVVSTFVSTSPLPAGPGR
jgi:hypothetical protein